MKVNHLQHLMEKAIDHVFEKKTEKVSYALQKIGSILASNFLKPLILALLIFEKRHILIDFLIFNVFLEKKALQQHLRG